MTQYEQYQNGQQHNMPFGYDHSFLNEHSPFMDFSQKYSSTPILNRDEAEDLNSFFNHPPDSFKSPELSSGDHDPVGGAGMKVENGGGGAFEGHMADYSGSNGTIHNPAVTLAQSVASSVETSRSRNQQFHMQNNGPFGYDTGGVNTEDDVAAAANNLYNFSHQGNLGQVAPSFNPALTGGSWGNIGNNLQLMNGVDHNMHSPVTSSGRQSSDPHDSQGYFHTHQALPSPTSQQEAMLRLQHQQQMRQLVRTRGGSLQLDTGVNLFPPVDSHVIPGMTPQSAGFYREDSFSHPGMIRFGSDGSFSRDGFIPRHGHVSQEDEKAMNLNRVPFAEQLQYNPSLQTPTYSLPIHQQRGVPRHMMLPQQTHKPPSSQPKMGGLPYSAPTPGAARHGHPLSPQLAYSNQDDGGEESGSDYEEVQQPSKRRKSKHEDDAEFTPDHHMTMPFAKRNSRANKAKDASEDDEEEYTPIANKSSKRRRSTAVSSSQGTSPTGLPSSDLLDSASRNRRKSRTSQPRLNLTEEEKRQNHIKSEKHRRDLIKTQYESLDDLVPGIKADKSSLSRADVLKEIVNFVESTVTGNDRIEQMLRSRAAGGTGVYD